MGDCKYSHIASKGLNTRSEVNASLKVCQIANHYKLQPATIRSWIRDDRIIAHKFARDYRVSWFSVWACEKAPMPQGVNAIKRYMMPLITKADIAAGMNVSVRTVDRWIDSGMPTRNVFCNVRLNPQDAQDWLKIEHGLLAPLYPYLTDEIV